MTLELQRNYKRNDTGPALRANVINKSDDSPLDLDGASIRFHLMDLDGVLKVDDDALIESPETEGFFRYEWSAGDLDEIGVFDGEFEITLASGKKETYPAEGYIQVRVHEDLDNG